MYAWWFAFAVVAYYATMDFPDFLDRQRAGFRADLQRWRQLVAADWLAALLRDEVVVAAPLAGWKLLEVGCDGQALYAGGHIPGAAYVDTQQFEQPPFWNAVPPVAFAALLHAWGIRPDSTVILYGRNSLTAARLAHLLLVAGVQDVRLLDGGLGAWVAAGHALAHGPQVVPVSTPLAADPIAAASDFGPAVQVATTGWSSAYPARPDYVRNMSQVQQHVQQQDATLVSIRSRAEFMGETSGYAYIARSGEIPGALWGHAGLDGDVNSMRSFQTIDGRMLAADYIAQVWRDGGIGPEQTVVFYCGTGWRASLAFFYAWLMGWPQISVYDGGWLEWSSHADNAVVCRTPVMKPPPALPQSNPARQSPPT